MILIAPMIGGAFAPVAPDAGTQTVLDELIIDLITTIRLDPSVFTSPGTYILIQYNTFTLYGNLTEQETVNFYLRLDTTLLSGLQANAQGLVVDTVNKCIKVTLI